MRLALVVTLLVASLTADAQSPPDRPTRVFVSGHSLTDLPMPAYLERIAGSLGTPVDWNRQYMVGSAIKHRARGRGNDAGWAGYSMGDNKTGQGMDVVRELRTNPYDLLLITEQHGVIDSLVWYDPVRHLRHYHDIFVAGNAKGRTFFFESWLGIPGRDQLERWIAYERRASVVWQCIVSRVNAGLMAEGRLDRISPMPMGAALAELMAKWVGGEVAGFSGRGAPEAIATVFQDDVHLTPAGAYYVALVAYSMMFEKAPSGAWHPDVVDAGQAASMQRVAGEFVSNWKRDMRMPSAQECDSLIRGDFLGVYLDHRRDEYWAARKEHWLKATWQRLKSQWTLRWRLWRKDPFGWSETDRSYWFPAP